MQLILPQYLSWLMKRSRTFQHNKRDYILLSRNSNVGSLLVQNLKGNSILFVRLYLNVSVSDPRPF